MNCKHCGKPITLVPSAQERARKFGGEAKDYTELFQYHTACTLELRAQSISKLMKEKAQK